MTDALLALDRCKPLSDPVRFFSRTAIVIGWVAVGLSTVKMALRFYFETLKPSEFFLSFLTFGAIFSLFPVAIWLLFRTGKSTTVFYLRAFSTDQKGARLRRTLKAALGTRYRLCGIRPPGKRDVALVRFLASGLTALRYLGSGFFELEAPNRNWMARLLISISKARAIIVDVRVLTPLVEDEITISWLAGGINHCIFLVDDTKSREAWAVQLAKLVNEDLPSDIRMIVCNERREPNVSGIAAAIRNEFSSVPRTPIGIHHAALEFVQKRVPWHAWSTRFVETDHGLFLFGLGIGIFVWVITLLLPDSIEQAYSTGVAATIVVCFVGLYFGAWGRAFLQACVNARVLRRGESSGLLRLAGSLLSMLLFLGFIGLLLFRLWQDSEKHHSGRNVIHRTHISRSTARDTNTRLTRRLPSPATSWLAVNRVRHSLTRRAI